VSFQFGPGLVNWLPIAGDWDDDGRDTVGLYNPSTSVFFLKNSNSAGVADLAVAYGPPNAGWLPIGEPHDWCFAKKAVAFLKSHFRAEAACSLPAGGGSRP
jgi:hypothetical protein